MAKSETQEPIFELSAVWHTYTGAHPIDALRGVDLQVHPGEYVAIIGANGSGKSTLARHLNALLLPTRGRVRVAGLPGDDEACKHEIRRRVQMVFQQPDYQIVATTVEEDVAFGPENFGVPEGELGERVQTALRSVDLWDQRERPPHMLSAGQKQRVAIAGALAVRPQALVLDEATAMLDPAGRRDLLEILRRLHQQGTTIVIVTHEMEEAAEAGRIVVLHEGQVVMDGEPRSVFSQADRLRSLNLDVPWLAGLSLELGLPVCLTEDEFIAALGPPSGKPAKRTSSSLPGDGSRSTAEVDQALIRVQKLQHTYLRGTPLAAQALNGITLDIARGGITGLIGPTGSGKSTLLQHLNGLLRPQVGHVILDGQDWASPDIDTRALRQKIGLLFQQPEDQLFEQYVGDDVAFGPRQLKLERAEIRRRVQTAMQAVGLPFEEFKDRQPGSLSGGERRRAAIAGVLALQPQVLAADEPTAGLDPGGRQQMLGILRALHREGVSLLLSSHRMQDIAALCERVIALRAGQVAADGTTREILGRPRLSARTGMPPPPLARLAERLQAEGWQTPEGVIHPSEIVQALQAQR